jgi:hypothetical protein
MISVKAQVCDHVIDQVDHQVWVPAGFRKEVMYQVINQVDHQVINQVDHQVWDQVWHQVWNQVWHQVVDQVWDQVKKDIDTYQ